MIRTLPENIDRGRRAIAEARLRGIDTTAWQERLAELEFNELLAWANQLAEEDIVLSGPLVYVEAPMRTVTTNRASWYVVQYLRNISFARLNRATGGWGTWTSEWWEAREDETLGALSALRNAMESREAA